MRDVAIRLVDGPRGPQVFVEASGAAPRTGILIRPGETWACSTFPADALRLFGVINECKELDQAASPKLSRFVVVRDAWNDVAEEGQWLIGELSVIKVTVGDVEGEETIPVYTLKLDAFKTLPEALEFARREVLAARKAAL